MECWLNGVGKERYPPTWDGLYMLLEDAQYSQVAEDLRATVNANSTTEDVVKEEVTPTSK